MLFFPFSGVELLLISLSLCKYSSIISDGVEYRIVQILIGEILLGLVCLVLYFLFLALVWFCVCG